MTTVDKYTQQLIDFTEHRRKVSPLVSKNLATIDEPPPPEVGEIWIKKLLENLESHENFMRYEEDQKWLENFMNIVEPSPFSKYVDIVMEMDNTTITDKKNIAFGDGSSPMGKYIYKDYSLNEKKEPSPFYSILRSGADFLKNKFSVMLYITNKKDSTYNGHEIEKQLFFSRITSVTIPILKPKTFSLKLPIGQVEKIASKMEGSFEGTMNIRLDDKWAVLKVINSYQNNNDEKSASFDYVNLVPPTSVVANSGLGSRIDMIVTNENLYGPTVESDYDNNISKIDRLHLINSGHVVKNRNWILEDVKFLGTDSIQFDVEGSSPTMLPIRFIAKRVYLEGVN